MAANENLRQNQKFYPNAVSGFVQEGLSELVRVLWNTTQVQGVRLN
jgi:hypothetical protein